MFPPKFTCWNSNFHSDIRRWGVWAVIRSWGQSSDAKDSCPYKRDPGGSLTPPPHEDTVRSSYPWTRRGSSVDTGSARALILGSPASRTVWFLLATRFMVLRYSIPKGLNRYIGQDSIYRLMTAWSWQGRTGVPMKRHIFGMLEQFYILTRWWLCIYTSDRVMQTYSPTPRNTHTHTEVCMWWNLNKVCRLHLCQSSGLGELGEGYRGTFSNIFAISYEYIIIFKLKS